jgi:hypothetical protein
MDLDLLGWDGDRAAQFEPWADAGHRPGRVLAAHRGGDLVATEAGELLAKVTGRLRHLAGPSVAGLPAVGDWVAVRDGRIHAVLPRRTAVTRRMAGPATAEQVLAANVDLVLAVVAPGRDANPRRIERLLALAWESGAQPVVVLGRADLCPDWGTDVATELAGLAAVAPGVQVLALSCYTGQGVDEIAAMLTPGRTAVLLGSSGVGKSTRSTAWPAATCSPRARSGTTARAATPPPPASSSPWPAAAWSSTRRACANSACGPVPGTRRAPMGRPGRSAPGPRPPSTTSPPWPPTAASTTAGTGASPTAPSGRRWRTADCRPSGSPPGRSSSASWPGSHSGPIPWPRPAGAATCEPSAGRSGPTRSTGAATEPVLDTVALCI